jgi:hypothetical protein
MKRIKLTQNQFTKVDDEDYEWLIKWNWQATQDKTVKHKKQYYVRRREFQKVDPIRPTIRMHRVIMEEFLRRKLESWEQIDHIDGDGLHNEKENLRVVNNRENCQNRHCFKTSKYPGVCWNKREQKWQAQIRINGINKYLGSFYNEIEGKKAYEWANNELKKDNPIPNLRIKTSKYKGVFWDKEVKKWRVEITRNGKRKYLGRFSDEQKAAEAYLYEKEKLSS